MMVTRSKPDPEIYEKACRLIDVPSQYAVALEDAPSGVRSAAAAGMPCDRRARSGGAVGRDSGACMEAVRQSDGCDRDDIRKRRMQTVLQSEMHSPFSRTGVYGIRTRGLNNANVARSQLR